LKKSWYDYHPTLSMAISLLHNTCPAYRMQTTRFIEEKLLKSYPLLNEESDKPATKMIWPLSFIQKRKSMDVNAWTMIEKLRYLSDEDREKIAADIIRYIYILEHEESMDFSFGTAMQNLEAAV
jgi:hypothetical protein